MTNIPVIELVRKDLLDENLELPAAYYTGPGSLTDLYVHVLTIACHLRQLIQDGVEQ